MSDPTRFAADWLALRAPADAAARDPLLLAAAAAHLAEVPEPLAVDLGAGSGATVAAFGTDVPGLHWRLVDHDPALLALASSRFGTAVEPVCADLADVAALPLTGARLVTASALLDLMTAAWVEALADRLAAAGVGVYAALSYDGAMAWDPALADDARVCTAFNRHQRGDKGLGPALGPDAVPVLERLLAARGFEVRTAPSRWRLGPSEARLHEELVSGIAAAAAAPTWGQARLATAATCTVGHVDLLALPAARAQSKITSVPRP